MKKIFFVFIGLMFVLTARSYSDVIVIYDPASTNIYSISDKADAVIPEGFKTATLPGRADDYQKFTKDYQYADGRLKLDAEKIKVREEASRVANDTQSEFALVDKRARKLAYEDLKKEGVTFKYVTEDTFK